MTTNWRLNAFPAVMRMEYAYGINVNALKLMENSVKINARETVSIVMSWVNVW